MKVNISIAPQCRALLDHYGIEHQTMKAIEEMAELTDALCKHDQYRASRTDVQGELADVLITVSQLILYYGEADVAELVMSKLNRATSKIQ